MNFKKSIFSYKAFEFSIKAISTIFLWYVFIYQSLLTYKYFKSEPINTIIEYYNGESNEGFITFPNITLCNDDDYEFVKNFHCSNGSEIFHEALYNCQLKSNEDFYDLLHSSKKLWKDTKIFMNDTGKKVLIEGTK